MIKPGRLQKDRVIERKSITEAMRQSAFEDSTTSFRIDISLLCCIEKGFVWLTAGKVVSGSIAP